MNGVYDEYKDLKTIKDVAKWVVNKKVSCFGTTKQLLYSASVSGVSGSLFYQKREFATPVAWAEYVSSTADKIVDYIIKNDKCLVPIYNR